MSFRIIVLIINIADTVICQIIVLIYVMHRYSLWVQLASQAIPTSISS